MCVCVRGGVAVLTQGGELFSLLNRRQRLPPKPDAQFYAACVLSALECVHLQSFLYRDVKPENVLLDAAGYAKVGDSQHHVRQSVWVLTSSLCQLCGQLVDFGFAKHVTDRTYTLLGTPEYMAPEIVLVPSRAVLVVTHTLPLAH